MPAFVELLSQDSIVVLEVAPQRFCLQLLTLCHASSILQCAQSTAPSTALPAPDHISCMLQISSFYCSIHSPHTADPLLASAMHIAICTASVLSAESQPVRVFRWPTQVANSGGQLIDANGLPFNNTSCSFAAVHPQRALQADCIKCATRLGSCIIRPLWAH